MENKECVIELKTVQEKARKATHIIESIGATITKMDRKDRDYSIWEDRSWKDKKDTDKETWTNGRACAPNTRTERLPFRLEVFYTGKSQPKNLFVLISGSWLKYKWT